MQYNLFFIIYNESIITHVRKWHIFYKKSIKLVILKMLHG